MALTHLTDLLARAQARAMTQYRGLVKFMGDVATLIAEVQQVEDAFWAFFGQLDLDAAQGKWLELLGERVGMPRDGFSNDVTYLSLIRAAIIANASKGDTNTLETLIGTALNLPFGEGVTGKDWYPAVQSFYLLNTDVTFTDDRDPLLQATLKLVSRARAVGVRTTLFYDPDVDANCFMMDDAASPGTATGKGFDDASSPGNINAGKMAGAQDAPN